MTYSVLSISGMGFPPYSSSHCTQSLEMVPQGAFMRQLNGNLVYLSCIPNHKYKSTIQGKDHNAPALGALSCGQEVEVCCIQPLWQEMKLPRLELHRPTRTESLNGIDAQGNSVSLSLEKEKLVQLLEEEQVLFPVFVRYFPYLRMLVRSFCLEDAGTGDKDKVRWSLTLEEV